MAMKRIEMVKDRFRRQLADGRLRRMEDQRRDLDARMERLKGELNAERQARGDLTSLVKQVGQPKRRKVGLIRLAAVGALAYVLGAKAGRQRYQQILLKGREGLHGVRGFVRRKAGSFTDPTTTTHRGMWMDRPDRSVSQPMRGEEGVMMR